MNPRILFLVASDYDDLLKKGVTSFLQEREEEGFFEQVITLHPWASQDRVLDISPTHRLHEMHEHYPYGGQTKALRYLNHPFHGYKVFREILRLIDQEKINMIRATDPVYTGPLAWAAARRRQIPFCVSIHSDFDTRHRLDPQRGAPTFLGLRSVARRIESFVLRRTDLVMPIRKTLADKIAASGVPADRIRVIPHGIDLSPFFNGPTGSVRQELSIDLEDHILSFAGRLSRENYVYDVVKLALALKQTHRNFVVVMAGDGPERKNLEQYLRVHDLNDKVRLVGFQSRDFIIELRKESSVSLCLMGGYSLIEACAAGRPVIAYDVEWHSELVKTGVTGYLLPEKNLERLIEAVKDLLYNPKDADWLGESAKTLAFQHHDIENTSKLKRSYYQELIARVPA